jgi:two-component system response regulator AtoC
VNPFVNFNLKPTKYPMGTEMIQNDGMLICVSEKMRRIKEMIDQTANTDVTVLIQGESGVGKEVVARTIHLCSSRRGKPFVKVNCAALPPDLLESELFGYEKGAFTGAYRQKPGKFELAHGGTIFLDEIVEINLSLQAKLLQVLQDREFPRLGGKQDIKVDVRVLAATNKNMEDAVEDGRFREDLYYRLNVVNVEIPPLRERREEIPIFVEHFLEKFAKKFNKKAKPLPERMFKAFLCHPWSGNVRQLENVIQRYVVLDDAELILQELQAGMRKENNHVAEEQNSQKKTWPSLKEIQRDAVAKAEAEVIRRVLDLTNWNRKKAAERLNISYKALLYKIKGDGVNLESFDHLYPPSVKDVDRFYLKEVGKKAAEEAEKRMIEDTLQETHWNRKEAARLLRVSYKALLYKIQKYRPGESP